MSTFARTLQLAIVSVAIALAPALAAQPGDAIEPSAASQDSTIQPAASVISTVHYQERIDLDCSSKSSCIGAFRKAGTSHQLNITRVSCRFQADPGTTFQDAEIGVVFPKTGYESLGILPIDFINNTTGWALLNHAVDVQYVNSQYAQMVIYSDFNGLNLAYCIATGTLSTLG